MQNPSVLKALAELNPCIDKDFESCIFQKDKSGYLSVYLNGKLQVQLNLSNGSAVISIPPVEQHKPLAVKPDFAAPKVEIKPAELAQKVEEPKRNKMEDIILSAICPGRRRAFEIQHYLAIKGFKISVETVRGHLNSLKAQDLIHTREGGSLYFTADEGKDAHQSAVTWLFEDWSKNKGACNKYDTKILDGYKVHEMGYSLSADVGRSVLSQLCRAGRCVKVGKGRYSLTK